MTSRVRTSDRNDPRPHWAADPDAMSSNADARSFSSQREDLTSHQTRCHPAPPVARSLRYRRGVKAMTTYGGKCFCGAVEIEVTGSAGGDGILPLQFVPLVVCGSRERFHLVEARECEGHQGRRVHRTLQQDATEHPAVLHQVRWPPHEQSSADRPDRRLCSDHPQSCRSAPGVHVNYAETVLPMKDGLPKLKDFPAELGGSGVVLAA